MSRTASKHTQKRYAEWLRMNETDGLTHQQIADKAGVHRSTVSIGIVRAKAAQNAPAQASAAPAAPQTAEPTPDGAAPALASPQITFSGADVAVEDAPNFGVPPATEAAPAPAPTAAAPSAPPPAHVEPVAQLDARPMVDAICMIVERTAGMAQPKTAGPPGPITPEEREALARAWGPFLVKHGGKLAEYAVEINALTVTLAVFGPRIDYYFRKDKEKKSASKTGAPEQPMFRELAPVESDEDLGSRVADKMGR